MLNNINERLVAIQAREYREKCRNSTIKNCSKCKDRFVCFTENREISYDRDAWRTACDIERNKWRTMFKEW